jgi:hypothetical protein
MWMMYSPWSEFKSKAPAHFPKARGWRKLG